MARALIVGYDGSRVRAGRARAGDRARGRHRRPDRDRVRLRARRPRRGARRSPRAGAQVRRAGHRAGARARARGRRRGESWRWSPSARSTRCSRSPRSTTRARSSSAPTASARSRAAILGSTPHKLLHLSERPVLVVPVARRLTACRVVSAAVSAAYDRLAELPISIESYELTGHDREFGDFTRPSTVDPPARRRRGGNRRGRRLRRPRPHRPPRRRPGARPHAAPTTLGEVCELLGELDLFAGAAPEYEPRATTAAGPTSRRRSTSRCARTGSRSGRWSSATRSRFASSARPGSAASATTQRASNTEAIRKRLDKYPDLRVQARPRERLGRGADRRDRRAGAGPGARPQGPSTAAPRSTSRPTPSSTAPSPRRFPEAYLEDPDINDETRAVLEPHADRVTWDAPLHSLADVKEMAPQGDQLEALAVRLAAGAARRSTSTASARGSRSTAAARARSSAAAARSSTWPRSFTPTRPTTSPPRATTTRRSRPGCRPARWTRRQSETGFRWAE